MTTEVSIAARATGEKTEEAMIAERISRGLDDFTNRGHLIEWVSEDRCYVPSSSRPNWRYLVRFTDEGAICRHCPDARGRALGVCRHRVAAMISRAKRPTYEVRSKHDSRLMQTIYVLYEIHGDAEQQIGWGNAAEMYWCKWELENPSWTEAA